MTGPSDIIYLGAAVWLILLWLMRRQRKRMRQIKHLEALIRKETVQAKRKALLLKWNDLGGYQYRQKQFQAQRMIDLGRKARLAGKPLSANPSFFSSSKKARLWKDGWLQVDHNTRWIQQIKEQSDAA